MYAQGGGLQMGAKRRVSLTGMVDLLSGRLSFHIVVFIQAKGLSPLMWLRITYKVALTSCSVFSMLHLLTLLKMDKSC